MDHVAQLLQAIAALAWVAFAFTLLFTLTPQIKQTLRRLKKGKLFGQEIELNDELLLLESSTESLVKDVPPDSNRPLSSAQEETFDKETKAILGQATATPKLALITLSAELEKEAKRALAVRGLLGNRSYIPLKVALNELRQYGFPANLEGSLELFNNVRNKIVHHADATDDDAVRALDSGITILRVLNAMPSEKAIVYHPGVEIFADEAGTKPVRDAKGVILEITAPGGIEKSFRIFPTTRTDFKKGAQVTWEWNRGRSWLTAWYRDPDNGTIKQAWLQSMEFVGRDIEEIR